MNPKTVSKTNRMIQQRVKSLQDNYGVVFEPNPHQPHRPATLTAIKSAEKHLGLRWSGNANHGDGHHERIEQRAPGGGRKPLAGPGDPTRDQRISMPASYWEKAKALGNGNTSAGIRHAIDIAPRQPPATPPKSPKK